MTNHIHNRDRMISYLVEDLVGPQTGGIVVDLNSADRQLLAKGRVNSLADREVSHTSTLRRMELFGQLPPQVMSTDKFSEQQLEALIAGPLPYDAKITTDLDKLRKEFFGDLTPSMMPKRPGPFLYESEYGSNEEMLTQIEPTEKYIVGVLFPPKPKILDTNNLEQEIDLPNGQINDLTRDSNIANLNIPQIDIVDEHDQEVIYEVQSNVISISFFAFLAKSAKIKINVTGGFYQREQVKIHNSGADREWWKRCPIDSTCVISTDFLSGERELYHRTIKKNEFENLHSIGPDFVVDVFSRAHDRSNGQQLDYRIVTVCLRNISEKTPEMNRFTDQYSIFQAFFSVTIYDETAPHEFFIIPYPSADLRNMDEEEKSTELLFQKSKIFGIGHNCAADWGDAVPPTAPGTRYQKRGDHSDTLNAVRWVCADSLPMYETAMLTPNIRDTAGNPITASMFQLSGLDSTNDGMLDIKKMLESYEAWIDALANEKGLIRSELQSKAIDHLNLCRRALARMKSGYELILNDKTVQIAFQWMNYSMLLQQINGQRRKPRKPQITADKRILFDEPYHEPTLVEIASANRQWRPFQLAFLLLSIPSTLNIDHNDRDLVELIWFPTGGGKTEAYLGLASMSMFIRRLRNNEEAGTDVIMRYTMRLLSTQQFQRATGLICAMDYIRTKNLDKLGNKRFSIGMYVGGGSTPNKISEAKVQLTKMQTNPEMGNPFVIRRCPWCGAEMGVIGLSEPNNRSKGNTKNSSHIIRGYEIQANDFIMRCSDRDCHFGGSNFLPIMVVDESMYNNPPTFLIGTVDKFANLSRNEHVRRLFGIDNDGNRNALPPNLIIQDELHLISGPLGTTVGFFEVLFEALCTSTNGKKPKIVSSTATVRQYSQQILALFGRTETHLFPPPGLSSEDSFFARHQYGANGLPSRGRLYVGVCPTGKTSSLGLQSRIYAALLAASTQFTQAEARDPWWTLLMYFNSLKDVGTATYLFQNTVPQDLLSAFQRTKTPPRFIRNYTELTGRLAGEEIPNRLHQLEQVYGSPNNTVIDACLATNIIEVGVDIDRLALMSIYSQPKSTAQYIQATGRVGRRVGTPGLIVSVLLPHRMRDRSHYEHFRSYHERLYAQVEPASVTPFSPTMLARGIHVLMLGAIRQFMPVKTLENGSKDVSRYRVLLDEFIEKVKTRAGLIEPEAIEQIQRVYEYRISQWVNRSPREWFYSENGAESAENTLAYTAGTHIPEELQSMLWLLPTSMRNVDSVSNLKIKMPKPIAVSGILGSETE